MNASAQYPSEAKPGLFIATPCYGGMVHYLYTKALIDTFAWCMGEGIPCGLYLLGNESLIPRGRNRCAHEFLRSGLSKLIFIDADLTWKQDDIKLLYESERAVVGGTYPIKTLPLSINVNPVPEQEERYFSGVTRPRAEYDAWVAQCADARGEVEVKHLPNGFLMIDRQVLIDLMPHVRQYANVDMTRQTTEQHSEFFWSGAIDGNYLSEDWHFSALIRKAGYAPYLQTSIVCPHSGTHTYGA